MLTKELEGACRLGANNKKCLGVLGGFFFSGKSSLSLFSCVLHKKVLTFSSHSVPLGVAQNPCFSGPLSLVASVRRVVRGRGHVHDLVVGLVRVLVIDGGLLLGGLLALLVVGRLDRGSGGGGVGVGTLGGGDGQGRLARGQGLGLGQRGVARLLVEVDAVADPVPFLRLEVGAGPAGGGHVALVALAGELVGDVDADVVGRGVEAADAAVGAVELGFFLVFFF